ncbi:MAG: GSU2403 family nucleotidyltransferase fold protein [Pseudomonadota bacterium]
MALTLPHRTLFAELLQRSVDASFDEQFPPDGDFQKRKRGNRYYWYYRHAGRAGQARAPKYAGPVTDTAVTERVRRFQEIKDDYRARQTIVRTLRAAGLSGPDGFTARLVEAMERAGFFRLRGVLVGTLAFQTYGGLLGIKLGGRAVMTEDADFAQFWGIAQNIDDAMPPILHVITTVDDTFAAVPSIADPFVSARYRNANGYLVDTLTPNRGSDEHTSRVAKMKALGNSGAQPLRHLDFLIHEPERSVLLSDAGVPVTVPRAERFAIHKLIVAVSRTDQTKAAKDIVQAATLIDALGVERPNELAEAFAVAWDEGPKWRDKLDDGMARLHADARSRLEREVTRWAASRRGRDWRPADPPDWLGR